MAPGIQLLTFLAQVRKGEKGLDFLAVVLPWSLCGGLQGPRGRHPGLKTGLVGAARIQVTGIPGRRLRQGILRHKFSWFRDRDPGAPVGLTETQVHAPASLMIAFVFFSD